MLCPRLNCFCIICNAITNRTDDTTAIANARNTASGKKPLLFNGNTKATGYWENLSPLIAEYLGGHRPTI